MSECDHGLLKRTCSICLERLGWGKLHQKPYRTHIADMFPEKVSEEPTKVRWCEKCKRRGPRKGNRVFVRLPRERQSISVGAPVYPPSWDGPIVVKPKVRRATHRRKGKWLCDRCDKDSPVRGAETEENILSAKDIFE
jgi:hypothetical protein